MPNPEDRRPPLGLTLVLTLAFAIVTASLSPAQTQPALQITSPADGTIVNPGQTITVTVSSPPGVTVSGGFLVAENPIGVSDFAPTTPAQLSITIPADLSSSRTYTLTALGDTDSGQMVSSPTILLDLERPDMPTSLNADSAELILESQGEQSRLGISATFVDGRVLDVTGSSNLVYRSSDWRVVTVNANGLVTAVADGSATITAIYGEGSDGQLQVSVPVTVEAPVLTPSTTVLNLGGEGGVNVGTSVVRGIQLTNNTANEGLAVTAVSITGGDF